MARVAHESLLHPQAQVIQMAKKHPRAVIPQLVSELRSGAPLVVVTIVVIFLWMRSSLPFEAEDLSVEAI